MEEKRLEVSVPRSHRWWIIIAAALGIFMAALDMNILNVALPVMALEFGTDHTAWVIISYTLTGVSVITFAGRLSDQIGYKNVMLWGLGIFLIGSVWCSLAQSFAQIIVFRVIQGVGAAFLTAPVMAIATVLFPDHERGKAMAVVGMIGPMGGIAGPALGGFLTEIWGWPAVFLVNVPVGIVSFLLLWRLLPESETKRNVPMDIAGTLLVTAGAFLLLLGLSQGPQSSSYVLSSAGVLLFILFPFVEKRVHHPIIPPSIFAASRYAFPQMGILATSAIGGGLGFVSAFFLQNQMELLPSQAGFVLLAAPLAMVLAARIGGMVIDRMGTATAAGTGAFLGLLGLAFSVPLNPAWSIFDMIWRMFLVGFGQGMFASASSVAVMAATPKSYYGVSGAAANLMRHFGFALGPAVAAFIWTPGEADSLGRMRAVFVLFVLLQMLVMISTFRYVSHRQPS